MTTVYTVVGQHRTVSGLLLLIGDDNRYYSRPAGGRPAPVEPTAAWVLDADRESGLDTAPVTADPDPCHSVTACGANWWRPLRALALVVALILGAFLAASAALAHAPALATTTATVALYEAPSADAQVLAELPAGTEIGLTGAAAGEFLEATFDGRLGWTHVDGLDGMIDTALVVVDASLRAAPNNDSAILGAVSAGSTVILTGASADGYLAAAFGGTGGWLSANAVA
jgi:SH3-like domain-containing protein